MDIYELIKKREYVNANSHLMDEELAEKIETDFLIRFAHNSTAIEGNTLSLIETKLVIEDQLSVTGKPLREIYEVANHVTCWDYVKSKLSEKKALNENIVKDIHEILMEKIFQGGIYRNSNVIITGAQHTPPPPNEAYSQIKEFYSKLQTFPGNDIEFAAFTHAEFVKIHPFPDGNGRTSRMIMNYQLMSKSFMPIYISNENKHEYYEVLDEYAVSGNLAPFTDMIYALEEKTLDKQIQFIESSIV